MGYGELRYFGAPVVEVAAAGSAIIETRGVTRIVAFFSSGTCSATPVLNAAGDPLDGSAATAMTSGTAIDAVAYYYKIEPSAVTARVMVLP